MTWYWVEYGRHVARRRRRRRRRAHAPAIHAASHVNHEKRVAWVSIPMHACGSVPIVVVLCLVTLLVAGVLLHVHTETTIIKISLHFQR